eukprot:3377469-Pleurochrysis_carterae.AAC.1
MKADGAGNDVGDVEGSDVDDDDGYVRGSRGCRSCGMSRIGGKRVQNGENRGDGGAEWRK